MTNSQKQILTDCTARWQLVYEAERHLERLRDVRQRAADAGADSTILAIHDREIQRGRQSMATLEEELLASLSPPEMARRGAA